jgi:hypothetical protein
MSKREELNDGEAKIELFLSDLAVNGKVAASTHHASLDLKLEISDCRSGDMPEEWGHALRGLHGLRTAGN